MPRPPKHVDAETFGKQAEVLASMQIHLDKLQSQIVEDMQFQIDAIQSKLKVLDERFSEVMTKPEMTTPASAEGPGLKDTVHVEPQECGLPADNHQEPPCATKDTNHAKLPPLRSQTLIDSRASYKCKDSCWELSLLIGMPELDIGGSVMTFFTLVIDILFQVVLAIVIQTNLVRFSRENPLYDVDVVRDWRILTGHHVLGVDPDHQNSRVARMCDGDFIEDLWWHNKLLTETQAFTNKVLGVPSGQWLGSCTIFIWILLMWSDIYAGLKFLKAIFFLPKNGSLLKYEAGGFVLASISRRRFAFVILIACIRVFVIGFTTISGVLWLADTRNLRQFLTNMAALKFIPNLDQLMFQCFISHPVQHVLQNMKPLPIGKSRFYRGLGLEPIILAIVCIIVIALVNWQTFFPNIEQADHINDALCGGEKNFIFGVNDAMGVLKLARTPPLGVYRFRRHQVVEYTRYVVNQVVRNPTLIQSQALAESGTVASMNFFVNYDVAEFFIQTKTSLGGHCDDYEVPFSQHDHNHAKYWLAMSFQVGLQNARFCADAIPYCHEREAYIVRRMCPVTCGCASPISAQHWQLGCPLSSICPHHGQVQRPCVDMNASDLGQNWSRKWNSWVTSSLGSALLGAQSSLAQGADGYIPLICDNFTVNNALHIRCAYKTTGTQGIPGDIERPVSAFCPISCECHTKKASNMLCPASCPRPGSRPGTP